VAVAGAGLGGLCLAQGLHRQGVDVTVYERDATFAGRPQGYRLHVDARAGEALRECLPPRLLTAFLATCGQASTRLTVVSERLRVLKELSTASGDADPYALESLSTSVNRLTFREVLATGLGKRIVFGAEVTGYHADDNGVLVRFADGDTTEADLLVGADRVNSAVRRQYLPEAEPADTGARCVYGNTPITPQALARLPPPLGAGFTAVIGGRLGMATGLVRFRNSPGQLNGVALSPAEDYLMWGLSGDRGRFPARLLGMSPVELHAMSADLILSWHPDLRALHAMAAVEETFAVRVRTSPAVPAWRPSRVTVLGDSIHAMSPAGGSGANIALRDAAELSRALTADHDVISAIATYETRMREYGYAAVAASAKTDADRGAMRNPVTSWLLRRLASGGAALRGAAGSIAYGEVPRWRQLGFERFSLSNVRSATGVQIRTNASRYAAVRLKSAPQPRYRGGSRAGWRGTGRLAANGAARTRRPTGR
jgi:2-polyprenyl-6-methoxyphenol hydroxylase-like FAD-dependent oxidoreductase